MTTKKLSKILLTFGATVFCATVIGGMLYAAPDPVAKKDAGLAPPSADVGQAVAKIADTLDDTPLVAINQQGKVYELVVRGYFYGDANAELYHSVYNKARQKWEPFSQITFGGIEVVNPCFGIDNQGNKYVAWEALEDKSRIYLIQCAPGGVWSAPSLVSPLNINAHNPTLAIEGNKVYVFYAEEPDALNPNAAAGKVKVVNIQEDIPVW